MKIHSFFYPLSIIVLCFLCFSGCGDGEDGNSVSVTGSLSMEDSAATVTLVNSSEFRWPPDATERSWEVTDAEIAELLAIDPPADWPKTENPKLRKKYYYAQLLKQFGDRIEIRYLIAYERQTEYLTHPQAIARSEAMYRLFPNEQNLKALQFIRSQPEGIEQEGLDLGGVERTQQQWMRDDPVGFIAFQRKLFVERIGDIPEVHTYLNFFQKQLLGEVLTDAELELLDESAGTVHRLLAESDDNRDDDNND